MIKEMLTCKDNFASRLIATVADIIIEISKKYNELPVVLSGGVFQNSVLTTLLIKYFKTTNKRFYIQQKTPVNDASISLGQVYFALYNQGDQ
jgi:hydrogenase maturation protein HypF